MMKWLIVCCFVSWSIFCTSAYALDEESDQGIAEKDWTSDSDWDRIMTFGTYLESPPSNPNNCSGSDDVVLFDISSIKKFAGNSFDADEVFVDAFGSGKEALSKWLDDWEKHEGARRLKTLFGLNWSNDNDIYVCVGDVVQIGTSNSQFNTIFLWYNGPVSSTSDNGVNTGYPDEAVTASDNGLTGSDLVGPGISTTATDSAVSGRPDFIVNKLWLETAGGTEKYEFGRNDEIKIRMYLKNIGDDDVDSDDTIETRLYLSDGYKKDPSDNWIRLGKEYSSGSSLDPGESDSQTEHMQLSEFDTIKAGKTYNIVACVDRIHDQDNGNGDYAEKHESNNCSTEAVFRVTGPFNFTIQSIALGGGKTSLGIGESFSIDVVARNLSDDAPTDTKVAYYIAGGNIGTTPVLIGIDNIKEDNFKTGVLKDESLEQVVAPKTAGLYTFSACADFGNRVKETNENDNCISTDIQVISPSPNPATRKTSTAILQLLFNK